MSLSPYLEDLDSKIPAIQVLESLGWTYLTPAQALKLRGGRADQVVLTGMRRPWLEEHARFGTRGTVRRFSGYIQHRRGPAAADGCRRRWPDPPQRGGLQPAHPGHQPGRDRRLSAHGPLAALHRPNAPAVLVTDGIDLDKKLRGTFLACGKDGERARSGQHRTDLIEAGSPPIVTTVIDNPRRSRRRPDAPAAFTSATMRQVKVSVLVTGIGVRPFGYTARVRLR